MDGSLILWITKTDIQGKKTVLQTTTAHTVSTKSMYHLNSEGDTLSTLCESIPAVYISNWSRKTEVVTQFIMVQYYL